MPRMIDADDLARYIVERMGIFGLAETVEVIEMIADYADEKEGE